MREMYPSKKKNVNEQHPFFRKGALLLVKPRFRSENSGISSFIKVEKPYKSGEHIRYAHEKLELGDAVMVLGAKRMVARGFEPTKVLYKLRLLCGKQIFWTPWYGWNDIIHNFS